ncbi:hypothetical protein PIB30_017000 [Stylosanthes scabra]|uniref:Uncharacterized protein n=1 Tax=Stylosanthes scabra TaxID=79078 RepID=A0ABU6Z6J5_9FABA|nr:hypothetical protein [Stylosanthes scabra]
MATAGEEAITAVFVEERREKEDANCDGEREGSGWGSTPDPPVMQLLCGDFESERKWKLAQTKKVALRASKGMLDQATRGSGKDTFEGCDLEESLRLDVEVFGTGFRAEKERKEEKGKRERTIRRKKRRKKERRRKGEGEKEDDDAGEVGSLGATVADRGGKRDKVREQRSERERRRKEPWRPPPLVAAVVDVAGGGSTELTFGCRSTKISASTPLYLVLPFWTENCCCLGSVQPSPELLLAVIAAPFYLTSLSRSSVPWDQVE